VKTLVRTIATGGLLLASVAALAGAQGADLTGAGATFPNPIYSKWFDVYATRTGVKINYQSIGSGGGVRQISEQTVDFGASDAPMTDDELSKAKGGAILHFPTVLGAVVITYNLPGVTKSLHLTGDAMPSSRRSILESHCRRRTSLSPIALTEAAPRSSSPII
jgi:phosphate transport system substrate-binding protein